MANTTDNPLNKPLVFCLDKSASSSLKQSLNDFSVRFFHDGKSLIKSLLLNDKTAFLPTALILTGDIHSIEDILRHSKRFTIAKFILCQNFTRQIYEPLMTEPFSTSSIVGLFTTIDHLKDALEEHFQPTPRERHLLRLITNHLDAYLWYALLRETSLKIPSKTSKSSLDLSIVNKRLEDDPLLNLYVYRSSISTLAERKPSTKKIFFGCVVQRAVLEQIQTSLDNLIAFNAFVHLQGHSRAIEARHQSLQCCSRRHDEVSIIFELESADQAAFKIIRVFNTDSEHHLWVAQLVGTEECKKLSRQFSHMKRTSYVDVRWQQPEILFGLILIEMKEFDKAHEYFFQLLVNQYDQLSSVRAQSKDLWETEQSYLEVVNLFATALEEIKSTASVKMAPARRETTYQESAIESEVDIPIALQDKQKISALLQPISYGLDRILDDGIVRKTSKATSKSRCCTVL